MDASHDPVIDRCAIHMSTTNAIAHGGPLVRSAIVAGHVTGMARMLPQR
jgi:hypothetical protein